MVIMKKETKRTSDNDVVEFILKNFYTSMFVFFLLKKRVFSVT